MKRIEFLKLVTGIVGGLGIPAAWPNVASAAAKREPAGTPLDDSYLVKGLTGMARAEGWFNAHWGAGILAGYYLCRDNPIDKETVAGIQAQLDAVLKRRASQFEPLPDETTDKALIEDVPRALAPAIKDGVRSHGHAVIFASLSLRALRDAPQMARPTLVKSLCMHSRRIARNKVRKPDDPRPYADTQAMIEALFDNLVRFRDLLGRPSVRRPNFTHMTTHTEALMNLDAMGYRELARAGHIGHRAHVGEPVPPFDPGTPAQGNPPTLETIMSRDFWQNEENQDRWKAKQAFPGNPNGDWIAAGHLFKVLYSYNQLARRIKDKEKVRLCSAILLERYLNPDVRGG